MALIVKNIPNKIPVKQVKGRDPRPKNREHMPNWTKWQTETINKLKAEKAAEAEDGRKAYFYDERKQHGLYIQDVSKPGRVRGHKIIEQG